MYRANRSSWLRRCVDWRSTVTAELLPSDLTMQAAGGDVIQTSPAPTELLSSIVYLNWVLKWMSFCFLGKAWYYRCVLLQHVTFWSFLLHSVKRSWKPLLSLAGHLFIEHKPGHLHRSPAYPLAAWGPNPSCCLSAGPGAGQIRGFYPGDFLTQMPAADTAEVRLPLAVHVHVFCCQGVQVLKCWLFFSLSSWPPYKC